MLDKMCGSKRCKSCKEIDVSEHLPDWSKQPCFSALIFRQWHSFLVLNRSSINLQLFGVCANYMCAASSRSQDYKDLTILFKPR